MALSTLLWAVPIFFVTGLVVGRILKAWMPTYQRGCLQLVGLVFIAFISIVIVTVLMSVVRSFDPETASEPRLRRIPLVLLFAPFAFGVIAGRAHTPKARMSRRHKTVQPAGSHHVPQEHRKQEPAPPASEPRPDIARPLPTPFSPGARDVPPPPPADLNPSVPPPDQPPPPAAPGC